MKNTFKKPLMSIAIILVMATGAAVAQQFGGPGTQQDNGPGLRLIDELALDESQAAEVQAILEGARVLHEETRAQARLNGETIRDETHAAIKAVLNPDQQARFEELLQLRAERWGGGFGGPRPAGRHGKRPGGDGECPNPDCPNPDCPYGDS